VDGVVEFAGDAEGDDRDVALKVDVTHACRYSCATPFALLLTAGIEFKTMGDASGAGVAPGPSETTPLIAPPPPGPEAQAASAPKRENSATSGGSGKNPFYGALRRTRRVAKALTNPWPKVRCAGAAPARTAPETEAPAARRFTPSSSALASAACCSATTQATSLSRCRCAASQRPPLRQHAQQTPLTKT
jgi:hypothetical protein